LEGAQSLLKEAGVPFEREIGSGDPASTLIEIAERHGCEAIILGARGMGALRSALLGPVSQAVLHASKAPVTIVKHAQVDVANDRGRLDRSRMKKNHPPIHQIETATDGAIINPFINIIYIV
jgi:hypothetical protein